MHVIKFLLGWSRYQPVELYCSISAALCCMPDLFHCTTFSLACNWSEFEVMSQRIGIMWHGRLHRCTVFSLACGLTDWNQRDWPCASRLWFPTFCGKTTHICSFWIMRCCYSACRWSNCLQLSLHVLQFWLGVRRISTLLSKLTVFIPPLHLNKAF